MDNQQLLAKIDALLAAKQDEKLKQLLTGQDPYLIAQVINHLPHGRKKTFGFLPPEAQAKVAVGLSPRTRKSIFRRLPNDAIARFLHFNHEDEAADIVQSLSGKDKQKVLEKLQKDKSAKIAKLLHFGPESAGGLMDLNFITASDTAAIKEITPVVQKHIETEKQTPVVVVNDAEGKIKGYVSYRHLLFRNPEEKIIALIRPLHLVAASDDQETVLTVVSNYNCDFVGVTDKSGQILGIVHSRDLLRVVQSEATEDIYKLAGVSSEETALDSPRTAVKLRSRWLIVNLGTALIASFVISRFQNTIAQMAILAAYMPLVAGVGGNTGTQALTVVVRGLALGEIDTQNAWRIIRKEVAAGFLNGLINALIIGFIIAIFVRTPMIALVIALAMVINMIIAGLFGAVVPLTLKALKIDPAVASSIFVTAATDALGFLAFLGLATIILL